MKTAKLQKAENALLFFTVLLLPTQLGRHFWPKFSFIYSLPVDYLSPTIYFWDILVFLLIAVFLILGKRFKSLPLNIFLVFILSQLCSLLVGLFVAKDINIAAGLFRLEQFFIAGIFGVYVASLELKLKNSVLFLPLSLAVLFESLLGIGQFLTGKTLGFWILGERSFSITTPGIAKFDYFSWQFLRPYATTPHPNVLAAFLLISCLILLFLNKSFFKIKIKALLILLAISALFLTVSRTVIVTLILISPFIFKNQLKKIGIIFLLISPVLYTRFSSILNYDNLSFIRREEGFIGAWQMFINNPLFGVGLNNFIPYISSNLISGPVRFFQPVHNIYLLTLSETGLIGLAGFIILFGVPLSGIFFKKFTTYNSIFITLIWFVIFFLGLFDHYFLTLPIGYRLIFFVWGLTFSLYLEPKDV